MASLRDPTRYGFLAGSGAVEAVLGILIAVGSAGDLLRLAIGLASTVQSVRRSRREKARTA